MDLLGFTPKAPPGAPGSPCVSARVHPWRRDSHASDRRNARRRPGRRHPAHPRPVGGDGPGLSGRRRRALRRELHGGLRLHDRTRRQAARPWRHRGRTRRPLRRPLRRHGPRRTGRRRPLPRPRPGHRRGGVDRQHPGRGAAHHHARAGRRGTDPATPLADRGVPQHDPRARPGAARCGEREGARRGRRPLPGPGFATWPSWPATRRNWPSSTPRSSRRSSSTATRTAVASCPTAICHSP